MTDLLTGLGTEHCRCGLCAWAKAWMAPAYKDRPRAHFSAARLLTAASEWADLAYAQPPGSPEAALHLHVAALHAHQVPVSAWPGGGADRYDAALRALVEQSQRFKRP